MRLGATPLEGRLVATQGYWSGTIEPRKTGSFQIMLWMEKSDAMMVHAAHQKGEVRMLHFDQLLVTVKGLRESDNVIPKHLNFANIMVEYGEQIRSY